MDMQRVDALIIQIIERTVILLLCLTASVTDIATFTECT